jgi:hypothetical protein
MQQVQAFYKVVAVDQQINSLVAMAYTLDMKLIQQIQKISQKHRI